MIQGHPSEAMDLPAVLKGFEHINRYWDRLHGIIAAKILPGEYYVTLGDEMIVTVLGSCISACVRDPVAKVGGMNHFMLPMSNRQDAERWGGGADAPTRYGNYAMEHMLNDIFKQGGRRERLEVKIIGGGQIIAHMTDVGRRNIEFVKHYLRSEGLKVVGSDVGGIHPRKVYYFPVTGRGQVKKLTSLHNNTITERERQYLSTLQTQPIAGEVELFT